MSTSQQGPSGFGRRPRPLAALLAQAYKTDASGVVTVVRNDGERTAITVVRGRVVNVSDPRTSSAAVVDILKRTGLISDRDVERAESHARREGMLLEDALVRERCVTASTVQNVRERLCTEVLMELIVARDVDVSAVWVLRGGQREVCALPIPYLLKEAQKRASLLPEVKRVVPSKHMVFVKTAQVREGGRPERWEELRLGSAEKQVYFFVDGRRNVEELALVTCQSLFGVSLALKNLHDAGLVKESVQGLGAKGRIGVSGTRRVLGLSLLMLLVLVLVGGIWFGMGSHGGLRRSSAGSGGLASRPRRKRAAAVTRVTTAVETYKLIYGKAPRSFQELVFARLLTGRDSKVAAALGLPTGVGPMDTGTEVQQTGRKGSRRR